VWSTAAQDDSSCSAPEPAYRNRAWWNTLPPRYNPSAVSSRQSLLFRRTNELQLTMLGVVMLVVSSTGAVPVPST
jgi:hypothetical protein